MRKGVRDPTWLVFGHFAYFFGLNLVQWFGGDDRFICLAGVATTTAPVHVIDPDASGNCIITIHATHAVQACFH